MAAFSALVRPKSGQHGQVTKPARLLANYQDVVDTRAHVRRRMADCLTEPFSSSVCLAYLQYVDGLGELAGAPGAAAELAENAPGLELGVRTLAGRPQSRVRAVGLFLRFRLVLPPVRDLRVH